MPHWLRPAGAGLLIGVVAIELPLILSVGFDATFAALSGELGPGLLATLLIAKLVVVALALGSGFAGGIFGPAIYLGAMLGGVTWYVLVWVGTGLGLPLPDALTTQGVYAVVGMAAVSSALLGAPISTILIVFELTRDYGVTLGVMTAAAVASTVMQFGEHGSFFRWQLSRRNVDIRRGRDISLLTLEPCEALVSAQYLRTDSSVTVGELEARMGSERQRVAVFVDDNEVLLGSTSLSDLIVHAIEHGMDSPAIDAAIDASYAIAPTTNIVSAVQLMAEHQVEYVPVVVYENMSSKGLGPGFDTLALHAGQRPDPTTGARATPIYQSTSFVFNDGDQAASLFDVARAGHVYSRISKPSLRQFGLRRVSFLAKSWAILLARYWMSSVLQQLRMPLACL